MAKRYIELSDNRVGVLDWDEEIGHSLTILAPVYPQPARATYFTQNDLKLLLKEFVNPRPIDFNYFNQYFEQQEEGLSFVDWLLSPVEISESDFIND